MTTENAGGFRFTYEAGTIRRGRNCVDHLEGELAELDCERALVVCGRTVGSTLAVIDPVRQGLGDRLAGVFDETTPEKRLGTALDGADAVAAADADAIVALGGGSSLDVAKAIAAIVAGKHSRQELGAMFEETGTIPVPEEVPPLIAVPTTLAGADLSMLAGMTADPATCPVDTPRSGGLGDPVLMPDLLCYDSALVETTPREILTASAMNGFDKGIESLYAANATPVTDAAAMRGVSLLVDALPTLTDERDSWDTADILDGIILVQYGISQPGGSTLSLIHAFGHGLKANADIQQGAAHAIIAPHALSYLFEQVDGRRDLLAAAFGCDRSEHSSAETATAVVDELTALRNALSLPRRLRDVDGLERDTLSDIAADTAADSMIENCPPGLEPTSEALRNVLENAW